MHRGRETTEAHHKLLEIKLSYKKHSSQIENKKSLPILLKASTLWFYVNKLCLHLQSSFIILPSIKRQFLNTISKKIES